jgi:alpha-amylase/alpha-mannosidase (GH57 family)
MTNTTAFAIHGHFYQPPREDPRTGTIPQEPGAAPYENWNERINATCYAPNSKLGNFQAISFNVGPTVAQWIMHNDPGTLARIVEQDRKNFVENGVGNAMAQAYNHTILPLSSREDKITQVRWGIEDFIRIFGHRPAGMWLPETAVDYETLEILAMNNINFTILAPWQAATHHLDYRRPYLVDLPNHRQISVFFYDADVSARVSFDPSLTVNADHFIPQTINPKFTIGADHPQIILVASDGELYGHHQPFRDKFLERVIENGIKDEYVNMTYPGLFLKNHPATEMINIHPYTSWSCQHGVSRWKEDCGCTPYFHWKEPLRKALDQLGKALMEVYLAEFKSFTDHPYEIRHRYIHVINGEVSLDELLRTFVKKPLKSEETNRLQLLLEAQFERQRMFTSCGWFFEDFDRIEPQNNIAYAAQACWLTYKATKIDLATNAIRDLEKVTSQRSGLNASTVFQHQFSREMEPVY